MHIQRAIHLRHLKSPGQRRADFDMALENHSALLTLAFLLLRRSLAAAAGPTPEPRALIARKALLYPPWS